MSQLDVHLLQYDSSSPTNAPDQEQKTRECGWCGREVPEDEKCKHCYAKEGDPCWECQDDCNNCKKF